MLDFSKPLYALAPLAGYTDLPFRSVVQKFGADWSVSEMINANALARENEKTLKMLTRAKEEKVYSVQIAAQNADIAKKAVEVLNRFDNIDGIDLNVGCPVKKAIKSGYGGNLLQEEENLFSIVKAIKEIHRKSFFSVKMRIGFDEINAVERAKLIEEAGADFITVHGRTVKQLYSGKANHDIIGDVKAIVSVPVLANGDITDRHKAKEVLEKTACEGVMVGRGAIGRPWVFLEMKEGRDITDSEKKEIILEHLDLMYSWYEERGVVLFRKHLHTYSKGYTGASDFREHINKLTEYKEMRQRVEAFF